LLNLFAGPFFKEMKRNEPKAYQNSELNQN